MKIDDGIKWNRNFKHFGAANPLMITGDEILAQLPTENDLEKANAISAIIEVLKDTSEEKYCIGHKFQTKKLDRFVEWNDVEVSSVKLGWPKSP